MAPTDKQSTRFQLRRSRLAAARHVRNSRILLLRPNRSAKPVVTDPRGPRFQPNASIGRSLEQMLLGRIASLDRSCRAKRQKRIAKGTIPRTLPRRNQSIHKIGAKSHESTERTSRTQSENFWHNEAAFLVQQHDGRTRLRRAPAQQTTFSAAIDNEQSAYIELLQPLLSGEESHPALIGSVAASGHRPAQWSHHHCNQTLHSNRPKRKWKECGAVCSRVYRGRLPRSSNILGEVAAFVRNSRKLRHATQLDTNGQQYRAFREIDSDTLISRPATAPPQMQQRLYQQARLQGTRGSKPEVRDRSRRSTCRRKLARFLMQQVKFRAIAQKVTAHGWMRSAIIARMQTDDGKEST